MKSTLKEFHKSKNYSTKWKNYFSVYDELLLKYVNKKITFVEIGVLDGGSLKMWKNFFGNNARIIGVDLNPNAKKFMEKGIEIYIGDQSKKEFWKGFFNKVGKVDIILDDGGHTNEQLICTTINCVPKIKNRGMLIIEDTHTSYLKEFGNPSKYSFINFSKKIVDDINFRFPKIGSYKFSLNKFVYSIQYYEGITVFNINKNLCRKNLIIKNKGLKSNNLDYRYGESKFVKKFQSNNKFWNNDLMKDFAKSFAFFLNKLKSFKYIKYFY
jgi:hypothetical protein